MRRTLHFVWLLCMFVGCDCGDSSANNAQNNSNNSNNSNNANNANNTQNNSNNSNNGTNNGTTNPCRLGQSLCAGVCESTIVDPDHCGDCDTVCDANEVCSSGVCASDCPVSLNACDRRCVDFDTDNAHCGDCDEQCPAGQGCVGGGCEDTVALMPRDDCEQGGPPIVVKAPNDKDKCVGDIAGATFRYAICTCSDFQSTNRLTTDAYDSAKGPHVPGGIGGGVGVNGSFLANNQVSISGVLWASGDDGIDAGNEVDVQLDVQSGGDLLTSNATLGADAYVEGDVDGGGETTLAGTLFQPMGGQISGNFTSANVVNQPVDVLPPCDCDPNQLLDIAGIVADKSANNDNAIIGLDRALLTTVDAPTRLDLPCGEYYLDAIDVGSNLTISTQGHVALYIGGDVVGANRFQITLDPTSQLDVFIGGSLCLTQDFSIGSPLYPSRVRLWVGGSDGCNGGEAVLLTNEGLFAGNVYAPYGEFRASNQLEMFGSVFAGSFNHSNTATVHYDRGVLDIGDDCRTDCPMGQINCFGQCADSCEGGGNGGNPGDDCDTCRDCNNQACNDGVCGECSDSSDCCAPLTCFEGTCLLIAN